MRKDRVPVQIDADILEQFKQLSSLTGAPVSALVREATKDWIRTIGAARMEVLAGLASGTPVAVINNKETAVAASAGTTH